MAEAKTPKNTKKAAVSRRSLPVKNTINLAMAGEKRINPQYAILGVALILAAAVVFSKFAVYDRYAKLTRAEHEVQQLRSDLNEGYARIDSYGELTDLYAHYTWSEMTEEELSRVDRVAVVNVIESEIRSKASVSTWSVTGNQLVVTVSAERLEEINAIAMALEQQPIVDYARVTSAATVNANRDGTVAEYVNAQITVYLVLPEESQEFAAVEAARKEAAQEAAAEEAAEEQTDAEEGGIE